jgi:DNA-directed RNA polymerase specialized sigma24 family protein
VNVLLNELAEIDGVPLDELELLALLVLLPLEAGALVLLLDLLELPHAATAKQAQIAATTRKSLLFSKLGTSS